MARCTDMAPELIALVAADLSLKDLYHLLSTCRSLFYANEILLYKLDASRTARYLPDGSASVLWASLLGRPATLRKALEAGCNPNARDMGPEKADSKNRWAFAASGHPTLGYPFAADCDFPRPSARSEPQLHQRATALHYAVYGGFEDVVTLLLDAGATTDGFSFCICSCESHLRFSASKPIFDLEEHIILWQPLHTAICRGHTTIAKLLLSRGSSAAEPCGRMEFRDAQHPDPHVYPIHTAAACGDLDMIGLIIAESPEIAAKDDGQGFTALHYACQNSNRQSTIKKLVALGCPLEEGADGTRLWLGVSDRSHDDYITMTPFLSALQLGNLPAAIALLAAGANSGCETFPTVIQALVKSRTNRLRYVFEGEEGRRLELDLLRALVASGIDVNEPMYGYESEDYRGPTALEIEASEPVHWSPDLMLALLKAGANPNINEWPDTQPSITLVKSLRQNADTSPNTAHKTIDMLADLVRFGARLDLGLDSPRETTSAFEELLLEIQDSDRDEPFALIKRLISKAPMLSTSPQACELIFQCLCLPKFHLKSALVDLMISEGFELPDFDHDEDAWTRLERAMFRDSDFGLALFCIKRGLFNIWWDMPIIRALEKGATWLVELMLSEDVSAAGTLPETGENALHVAIRMGCPGQAIAKLLRAVPEHDINALDRGNRTPLSLFLSNYSTCPMAARRQAKGNLEPGTYLLGAMLRCGAQPVLFTEPGESTDPTKNPGTYCFPQPLKGDGGLSASVSPLDYAITCADDGPMHCIAGNSTTGATLNINTQVPPGWCSYLHRAIVSQRWEHIPILLDCGVSPDGGPNCRAPPITQILRAIMKQAADNPSSRWAQRKMERMAIAVRWLVGSVPGHTSVMSTVGDWKANCHLKDAEGQSAVDLFDAIAKLDDPVPARILGQFVVCEVDEETRERTIRGRDDPPVWIASGQL